MAARKSKSLAIVQQPGAQLYRRFVEGIKERIGTSSCAGVVNFSIAVQG
jgi:hypothetical protein